AAADSTGPPLVLLRPDAGVLGGRRLGPPGSRDPPRSLSEDAPGRAGVHRGPSGNRSLRAGRDDRVSRLAPISALLQPRADALHHPLGAPDPRGSSAADARRGLRAGHGMAATAWSSSARQTVELEGRQRRAAAPAGAPRDPPLDRSGALVAFLHG